uniref:Putative secreted protein n=1 Tax=Psorophora albipes TaxID=869069 RepID=T1E2W9_9DIPT
MVVSIASLMILLTSSTTNWCSSRPSSMIAADYVSTDIPPKRKLVEPISRRPGKMKNTRKRIRSQPKRLEFSV